MKGVRLLIAFISCSPAPSPAGPITLIDDARDTVRLARPAERIASLIPATTELLFAIGAGDRVVGRTTWCDWPPEALEVPSLGDGIEPNLERIVAARPDLVVLYRSTRNALAAERLRALDIPTVQLRTDLLDDLDRSALVLGEATGLRDSAAAVVDRLHQELEAARRPPGGVSVLVLAWDQPPMVIGAGSFLHQVVELAGASNVFADLSSPSATVSLEAIAVRDPDLILTTSDPPAFLTRPEWQVIAAVRERRLVRVEGSEFARPTPRAPAAVRSLATALDSAARR